MADIIRWGILGTGAIARQFAEGLDFAEGAGLVAVGSRTQANADRFLGEREVPFRHGRYEDLAANPDIDAVYIATPHSAHCENTLLCLSAGKAVLCEKPFAVNAAEAKKMVAAARRKKLFLMEAMWTRFFPLMVRVREMIAAGAIGQVRMLQADFGFRTGWRPSHRLLNPQLAGGALLDVGIYPLSLASMLLGRPENVVSLAHLGTTGVDEQTAMVLGYGDGALAVLSTAIRTRTPHTANILGDAGRIEIHSPWWRPSELTLLTDDGRKEITEIPFRGNGYQFEANEVRHCLLAGRTESATMPLDETLALMRTLDEIRSQIGLTYPME